MGDREQFQSRYKELAPIIYYGDIYHNVQLSIFSNRPDGKVYAYCDAMIGSGELKLIACITDQCEDCRYADSFDQEEEWADKIKKRIFELGLRMDWYARYWQAEREGNWPMKMSLDEKLTTGFVEAYIPSKDTAAYLRSIQHEFSDVEKATLISHHECLTREEKLEALQRMKEWTKDMAFREKLDAAMKLIRENKESYNYSPAWDIFHDFIPIPHDFRHGDIVDFAGYCYSKELGLIWGYDEKRYQFYCNRQGDYSDVEIEVETPFVLEGYGVCGDPIYHYQGDFSHEHVNPIYIQRARLSHDNECGWYMEWLANIGTPDERSSHLLAQRVIAKQVERVWSYYPGLSLTELIFFAAKAGELWYKSSLEDVPVKDVAYLPEADDIEVLKVKDFNLMHGLWWMLQKAESNP